MAHTVWAMERMDGTMLVLDGAMRVTDGATLVSVGAIVYTTVFTMVCTMEAGQARLGVVP